jgi:hypothetical protein
VLHHHPSNHSQICRRPAMQSVRPSVQRRVSTPMYLDTRAAECMCMQHTSCVVQAPLFNILAHATSVHVRSHSCVHTYAHSTRASRVTHTPCPHHCSAGSCNKTCNVFFRSPPLSRNRSSLSLAVKLNSFAMNLTSLAFTLTALSSFSLQARLADLVQDAPSVQRAVMMKTP